MLNEDGEESYYAERFRNATQKFDEEFLKRQVLVIIEKGHGMSSIYYDVTGVSKNSDSELEIEIDRLSAGAGDAVVRDRRFLIEIAEDLDKKKK